MSIEAINWAFECDVMGPAKAVLLVLANHADCGGTCWPGQDRIAKHAGCSSRTVRNAVAVLVDKGVLTVAEVAGVKTVYTLHVGTPARHSAPERGSAPEPISALELRAATPERGSGLPRNVVPLPRNHVPPNLQEPPVEPSGNQQRARRAHRLPDDWAPSRADVEFATGRGLDWISVSQQFCDHWHSEGGAKSSKMDWSAAWRVWCRRENAPPHGRAPPLFAGRPTNLSLYPETT